MKPTEKQIINALEYLGSKKAEKIVKSDETDATKKYIPNTFNGYIASFGGSIVQAGLLPTALIYCNDSERKKLAEALFHLYEQEEEYKKDVKQEDNNLMDYLQRKWKQEGITTRDKQRIRNKLVQIATALKLAIRSYELKK